MPISNFPNGFAAGLSVRGIPLLQAQPGNVFWVDNSPSIGQGIGKNQTRCVGGSDNNPGTFQRPVATLAYALTLAAPGNGDIIFVKPGHMENVNGAGTTTTVYDPTGLIPVSYSNALTLGVGGVAIIGLGAGGMRPMLQFSTATTANVPVTASGISIQNFQFISTFAAVVSAFTGVGASCATSTIVGNVLTTGVVTGTLVIGSSLMGTLVIPGTTVLSQLTGVAGGTGTYLVDTYHSVTVTSTTITAGPQDFNIENCEFRDSTTAKNFLACVTTPATANGMDGMRIAGSKFTSLATAAAAANVLTLGAAIDRLQVVDNVVNATATTTGTPLVVGGANAVTNMDIGRNKVFKPTVAASFVHILSTSVNSTGMCYDNYGWSLTSGTGLTVTAAKGIGTVGNFCTITGAADKSAIINPVQA